MGANLFDVLRDIDQKDTVARAVELMRHLEDGRVDIKDRKAVFHLFAGMIDAAKIHAMLYECAK